jgi:phosphoglycolate phosphatase
MGAQGTLSPSKNKRLYYNERFMGTVDAAMKETRFSEIRARIFDLDGTLIDSKLDLALAVNAALTEMGRAPLPHDRIFGYIGQGAQCLITRSLGPGATEDECRRSLQFFLEYYALHKLDNTAVYPGVREALQSLSGIPMAILTNKPVGSSGGILKGLGLSDYFRAIYGGNSFETKKPDPLGVATILREFGAKPEQALFVGDSEIDVQTARNAGTWICGVTYGFGSHHFSEYPPDLVVDSLEELLQHLPDSAVRDPR